MTTLWKKLLPTLLALAALLGLIAWMAGAFRDKIEPGLTAAPDAAAGDVHRVVATEEPLFEAVPASVAARETTIVAARLLARITEIAVRAGDYVDAGDLLVSLEQSDLEARVEQAQERVRSLAARLEEAERTFARSQELEARGVIAAADLDTARANADALQAELAAARQAVLETQAALGYSRVTAPIPGRVVNRYAEPGDTVQPGQRIVSLYNPASLGVEAWVREGLALALAPGQTLAVEVPAAALELDARIQEIVPAADPGSRAFLVKALFPAEAGLLPGMYARVRIPAGSRERLLIPAGRIREVGQLPVVWVATDSGVARRFLRLGGRRPDGQVEVLAGLAVGERLLPPPKP